MDSFNPDLIPQIWMNQNIGQNLNIIQQQKEKKQAISFGNEPNEVTWWLFIGKIIMGLITWWLVAAILFALSWVIGSLLWWNNGNPSEILWIVLAVVGFITGMIWNMWCAFLFSIIFSKRYYKLSQMLWLVFTSTLIIFILFIPIYFFFQGVLVLYSVLWFQIIFSFFITISLLDFLSHPNYSASSLMGNLVGFMLSCAVYLAVATWIIKADDLTSWILPLMILPSLIWYTATLIGSCIRDAVYYKFFEWWSNPFYLTSLSELKRQEQKEIQLQEKNNEDVNVEIH